MNMTYGTHVNKQSVFIDSELLVANYTYTIGYDNELKQNVKWMDECLYRANETTGLCITK